MFSLASGIYQSYFAPPKLSILIVGLDSSGKTSLLERIKVTQIDTILDISSSSTSSAPQRTHNSQSENLRAKYAKGAVAMTPEMAGGAISGEVGENGPVGVNSTSVKKAGYSKNETGGKPARLPPPLPPRKAARSHEWSEEILKGSSDEQSNVENGESNATTASKLREQDLLDQVPPPPLAGKVDNGPSSSATIEARMKPKANKRPPLPKNKSKTQKHPGASTPISPSRRSFIQFLRCPSPQSYSSAGLEDEDDEIVVDDEDDTEVDSASLDPTASTTTAGESNDVPLQTKEEEEDPANDSIDHLSNYYINFQESEEFDLMPSSNLKGKKVVKMFPLDKIRPTLGQNLAKLDLSGCKCSLFDLSGAEKMRPLWERYYADTDAIIYVVNAAETSFTNMLQCRREFEKMCNNKVLKQRIESGLPVLIFANKLDIAYREYDLSVERANKVDSGAVGLNGNNENTYGRGISWNPEEEDNFVGGETKAQDNNVSSGINGGIDDIPKRVIDFRDLVALFGMQSLSPTSVVDEDFDNMRAKSNIGDGVKGNIFLFGGSAKTGEGVRSAMEYLVANSKQFHLDRQPRST